MLDGFSKGFSLNYEGPRGETECHNLKSIQGNELVAMKLVLNEVILDRIAGPFIVQFNILRLIKFLKLSQN